VAYTIKNGKIETETCELNVAHHCNLTCRACAHFSPALKQHYIDPDQILRDLSLLSKHYAPEHVRLLGGEPLLHPRLLDVINAVRGSGISSLVRVVTNGVLLWRMESNFWEAVDEVHVSVYPGREMTDEQLAHCEQQARRHHVDLKLLYFDRFRESYSELGTEDRALTERIYKTCEVAHYWRCHNVSDGYFYRCPQSVFLPRLLKKDDLSVQEVDGLRIVDSPSFGEELLAYLESERPLKSCKYCLGSVGKLFDHEMVSRKHWQEPQQRSTEQLLDTEFLSILENLDPDADNLCQRSHLLASSNRELVSKYNLPHLPPHKSDA
jgi:cyclic pyranopterin phosphate synthase